MSDILQFSNREEFRAWLSEHGPSSAGRERRLAWIADRLNQNLKPM